MPNVPRKLRSLLSWATAHHKNIFQKVLWAISIVKGMNDVTLTYYTTSHEETNYLSGFIQSQVP